VSREEMDRLQRRSRDGCERRTSASPHALGARRASGFLKTGDKDHSCSKRRAFTECVCWLSLRYPKRFLIARRYNNQ
jgi:hypothetical protein